MKIISKIIGGIFVFVGSIFLFLSAPLDSNLLFSLGAFIAIVGILNFCIHIKKGGELDGLW